MSISDRVEKLMDGYVPGIIEETDFAAVLIPLVELDGELCFIFEKRSENIKQPGDVCFPGGRIDEGESIVECALRETREEIGISEEHITVLGEFDKVRMTTGRRSATVVGMVDMEGYGMISPQTDEVAEVFTVPLKFFREAVPMVYECRIIQDVDDFPYAETGIRSDYKWRVGKMPIYIYHYENQIIWGMTARIVKWFVDKLY